MRYKCKWETQERLQLSKALLSLIIFHLAGSWATCAVAGDQGRFHLIRFSKRLGLDRSERGGDPQKTVVEGEVGLPWGNWCVSPVCLLPACVSGCLAIPSSCSLIDYPHNLSGLSGPSCLHKRRKVIGGILLCKLRTTAKFIVILTMIQESLDHPSSTDIIVCGDGVVYIESEAITR